MIWGHNRRVGKAVFSRSHSAVFITFDSLPDSRSQERDSDWLSSDHMVTHHLYQVMKGKVEWAEPLGTLQLLSGQLAH